MKIKFSHEDVRVLHALEKRIDKSLEQDPPMTWDDALTMAGGLMAHIQCELQEKLFNEKDKLTKLEIEAIEESLTNTTRGIITLAKLWQVVSIRHGETVQ